MNVQDLMELMSVIDKTSQLRNDVMQLKVEQLDSKLEAEIKAIKEILMKLVLLVEKM